MKHYGYGILAAGIFSLIVGGTVPGALIPVEASVSTTEGSTTSIEHQFSQTAQDSWETQEEEAQEEKEAAEEKKTQEKISHLKKVTQIKLVRFSTHQVKVTWKKTKKAKYYRVYYSKEKKGHYKLAGVTQNTYFLVNHLKNNTRYYFYVQACSQKKASASDSKLSGRHGMTMKKYRRKIIFAGDSICEGIGYGYAYPQMHSSAKKSTVAYRGLNTITYHTKRVFGGMTGLQKLVSQHPYRVYIMLGLNEIHARKSSLVIADYKSLVESFHQACPNTDIVLCAISPVTRAERASHPGMWQIPKFNRQLKKLAKKKGYHYLDYTDYLKDSQGYLKSKYAASDGYHWKPAAYVEFGKRIGKYDKSLDS